jgi:ParB family chromosome partitioning protein
MESQTYQIVPLKNLHESSLNRRTHYDDAKIVEMAESIKAVGIIEPLVVRTAKGGKDNFEIVAGSRRYRAAKVAALEEVPILLRDLDDRQVVEIMVTENNQREDVNALEEAEGLGQLLGFKNGYSLDSLAQKIGRSTKYVYDRLKLLQLIPEAKKLVLSGRMTAGHAILLARLKPDEQERAIDPDTGGLFQGEHLLFNPNEDRKADKLSKEEQKYYDLKARSVRELEGWIDEHVRFDRNAPIVQDLFPETAAAVTDAKDMKLKVIQITRENFVQPDAKEGNTERIFSERTWKLADGSSKEAKTCDKWVTGVVVIGPERGAAHKVCVHKECPVHWAKEKRERERRAKMSPDAANRRAANEEAKQKVERERKEERRRAFEKAKPAIISACVDKIKKAKFGELAQVLYRDNWHLKDALKVFPKPKTIEDLARLVALGQLLSDCQRYQIDSFTKAAKLIGVHVGKIMTPEPVPAAPQTSAKKNQGSGMSIQPNSEAAIIAHALHSGEGRDKVHLNPDGSAHMVYDEPTCIHCGCQELSPCPEGCAWVTLEEKTNRGLCTSCSAKGHKLNRVASEGKEGKAMAKKAKKKASKKKPASKKKETTQTQAAG